MKHNNKNDNKNEKDKDKDKEKDKIDHGKSDNTIGGVIDYSRAQALKLSSVLDTQWAKLLVTTHTRQINSNLIASRTVQYVLNIIFL